LGVEIAIFPYIALNAVNRYNRRRIYPIRA